MLTKQWENNSSFQTKGVDCALECNTPKLLKQHRRALRHRPFEPNENLHYTRDVESSNIACQALRPSKFLETKSSWPRNLIQVKLIRLSDLGHLLPILLQEKIIQVYLELNWLADLKKKIVLVLSKRAAEGLLWDKTQESS